MNNSALRKPDWLKMRLPQGRLSVEVSRLVKRHGLHTICVSGRCPNQAECWECGTATFMIAGDVCTRSCRFCNVATGRPLPLDADEPAKVAASVARLGLRHAVLTSVDRDDLPDLGAAHWVAVIRAVKAANPSTTMETLIPDFQGRASLIAQVVEAGPDVVSHNLETVRRLTPTVRSAATYERSLAVVEQTARAGVVAKSGIMLGLGETRNEVLETMDDLRNAGCSVMTIGQYLQPSKANIPVAEYIRPEVFAEYEQLGKARGFAHVESGPFVRSSYHAEKHAVRHE